MLPSSIIVLTIRGISEPIGAKNIFDDILLSIRHAIDQKRKDIYFVKHLYGKFSAMDFSLLKRFKKSGFTRILIFLLEFPADQDKYR